MASRQHNFDTHWETETFSWPTLLQEMLYHGGLESNHTIFTLSLPSVYKESEAQGDL